MKVKLIDENNIIVFLNDKIININSDSRVELEDELRILFKKLSNIYNLEIYWYYNISIYVDDYYGSIINLVKEDIDYIEYDKDQIDMRIIISKKTFLYKINNIFNLDIDSKIYKYNNNYYLKLNKKLDNKKMGLLLELSELIIDDVDMILKYGNVLQNNSYVI